MGIVMIGIGILIMGISLLFLVLRTIEGGGDTSSYVEPTTKWPREEVQPEKFIHPEVASHADNMMGRVQAMVFLIAIVVTIISWSVFQHGTTGDLNFAFYAHTKEGALVKYEAELSYSVWPPTFNRTWLLWQ